MGTTLLLNASYEPLNIISVRRAIVLVLKNKAEIIEEHVEKRIHTVDKAFPYPLVVRLVFYIEIPRKLRHVVTNRLLFARDHYTCQYCGQTKSQLKRHETFTREHVKPISRGGADSWDNVTTACSTCNIKKGGRLPYEARMYPKSTPFEPRYIAIVLFSKCDDEVQKRYIKPFLKESEIG